MIIIPISGIIHNYETESETNVTPTTLRESLDKANGEDIRVTVHSPGGLVYAGLEMFSMLRNYSGNVETRVVSMAASMGSILAIAGDKKTVEDTASFMIHNAITWAFGDYKALIKEAKDLEKLTASFYAIYAKYTTLSREQAKEYMDAETYFYGEELQDLGFEIVDSEDDTDRETAQALAMARIEGVKEKVKPEDIQKDLDKAATSAFVNKLIVPVAKAPAATNNNKPTHDNKGGQNKETHKMTLAELKEKYPELYNAIVGNERDRVMAHLKMAQTTGAHDLAQKAIEEGTEMTASITAEYMAALATKQFTKATQIDEQTTASGADGAEGNADDEEKDAKASEELLAKVAQKCGVKLKKAA